MLAATFVLISPPSGRVYPGAIPWRPHSLLRPLVDAMSLRGVLETARGVEIKDVALHVAAAVGLALLAVSIAARGTGAFATARGRPYAMAQVLLGGWVTLSVASASWSGDPALTLGQSALYVLTLAWAVTLAWTLERRHVQLLLAWLVALSAVASGLCIWYFHERNPYHRPGFPIGNPAALAAAILPAILLCVSGLGELVANSRSSGRIDVLRLVAWIAALIPLLWCFSLTNSRGALAGLALGLTTAMILMCGRRMRWVVLPVAAVILATGAWWIYSVTMDAGMGRGSSLRLRAYFWRYAAELWQQLPLTGHGAGSFPRLASELSLRDRILDPAAFGGDWVEHAHNELFEVFAEIGLVGGVTYVAGLLATLVAGLTLLRQTRDRPSRWSEIGLITALVALWADAMFGVGLRLSGVPAVYFTLLGALWALCRNVQADSTMPRQSFRPHRHFIAAAVTALAIGAAWLAASNAVGLVHEQRAIAMFGQGEFNRSLIEADAAERGLLDPVRKLFSADRGLQARFELARAAAETALPSSNAPMPATSGTSATAPLNTVLQGAISLTEYAYGEAMRLDARAPGVGRALAIQARCAEILSALYRLVDPRFALEWRKAAETAWLGLRQRTPYDAEALVALQRYPAPIGTHLSYLRDALRDGFPDAEWTAALEQFATAPGFDEALNRLLLAASPNDPQSDLNWLVASMAPEAYRLSAIWKARRGDYVSAIEDVQRAATLYEPMRPRFLTLYSVALAEQAEYVLLADPANSAESVRLVQQSIAALPIIQEQQYEAMTRPFRLRLVSCLLAADRENDAVSALHAIVSDETAIDVALANAYVQLAASFVRRPTELRPPVDAWIDAARRRVPAHLGAWSWKAWLAAQTGDSDGATRALQAAETAGLPKEDVERIRRGLCHEFPPLCEALGS